MKLTLLQIGKQAIFPQKVHYLPHGFYVTLTLILNIDEDVIQIYDGENIKLFCPDLVDIALETGQSVE